MCSLDVRQDDPASYRLAGEKIDKSEGDDRTREDGNGQPTRDSVVPLAQAPHVARKARVDRPVSGDPNRGSINFAKNG